MIISRKKYLWNEYKKRNMETKLLISLVKIVYGHGQIWWNINFLWSSRINKIHTNSSGVSFVCCSGTVKNLENMISFMLE